MAVFMYESFQNFIPEFRILRVTFRRKSASKSRIRQFMQDSNLFSDYLKIIDHLNLKLFALCCHTAGFRI